MQHQSISLYTLDVKGGKILEINDLVGSDVKALDKAVEGDFVRDVIVPDLRARFDGKDVVYFRPEKHMYDFIEAILESRPEEWDGIIVSGYNEGGTDLLAVSANKESKATIANATNKDSAIFLQKAFFDDLATQCGLQSFPRSRHYSIEGGHSDPLGSFSDRIARDFEGIDYVVLKPVDANQGKGIIITPTSEIEKELDYLLNTLPRTQRTTNRYGDHGFSEKYWRDEKPDVFEVQEFVEDQPVEHAGKTWDGTRRYVMATIIEQSEEGELSVSTKAYGGFVKLPRQSISDDPDINHASRISFSYSHNSLEWLGRKFGFAERGSGEQVILTDDQVQEDTAQILSDMNALYAHLHRLDPHEYVNALAQSDIPADRSLARSMASYLEVKIEGRNNTRPPEPDMLEV